MIEVPQIPVFLSPVEAELFKKYQEHHWLFEELERSGAFNVQFGKVILNVAFGQVQNIVKEEVVYKR